MYTRLLIIATLLVATSCARPEAAPDVWYGARIGSPAPAKAVNRRRGMLDGVTLPVEKPWQLASGSLDNHRDIAQLSFYAARCEEMIVDDVPSDRLPGPPPKCYRSVDAFREEGKRLVDETTRKLGKPTTATGSADVRGIGLEWDFAEHDAGCVRGTETYTVRSRERSGRVKTARLYIDDEHLSLRVDGFQPVTDEDRGKQLVEAAARRSLAKRCANEFAEQERERAAQAAEVRTAPTPNNVATWNSPDDYPPVALAHHVEGTTSVRLDVGDSGRVVACHVTVSSGSPELDQMTCRNAARRGRFRPVTTEDGIRHAGEYDYTNEWRLPR